MQTFLQAPFPPSSHDGIWVGAQAKGLYLLAVGGASGQHAPLTTPGLPETSALSSWSSGWLLSAVYEPHPFVSDLKAQALCTPKSHAQTLLEIGLLRSHTSPAQACRNLGSSCSPTPAVGSQGCSLSLVSTCVTAQPYLHL